MILSVPFSYEVVGFEPRRQNATRDSRKGFVEVWVEEMDPADAPVAIVWRRPPERRDEVASTVEIRMSRDGLRCSAADSADTPRPPEGGPLRGEALAEAVRGGVRDSNPFAAFLSGMPADGREERLFRREASSTREAVEASVRARAAQLVAIDGELFLPCAEPVLVRARSHVYRASEAVSVRWYEPWLHSHGARGGVYRLDEWDVLLRDARRDLGGRAELDLPDAHPDFDVLDPSALALPLEGSALAQHALELLGEMGGFLRSCAETSAFGRHFGSAERDGAGRDRLDWRAPFDLDVPPAGVAEAFVRLSSILSGGLRDDASLEALREVVATPLPARARHDRMDGLRDAMEATGDALARWDGRPARLRDGSPEDDLDALADLGPRP